MAVHRGSTSDHHPTTPAATAAHCQEAKNPSDDGTGPPSQNRTPRLKVQVYKLEHLAESLVSSASRSSSNETGSGGTQRLPNEVDLQLSSSEIRGLSDEQLTSNSREQQSRVAGVELQTDPLPDKPARESLIIHSQATQPLGGEDSSPQHSLKTTDPVTAFTMECAHGYNRLEVGVSGGVVPARRRGSGQYDKLATKDPLESEVIVQTFGAIPEQDGVAETSGRGWDGDRGRAYFIGGRGRESELEGSGQFRESEIGHENASREDSHTLKRKLQSLSGDLQQHIELIAERVKSNLQSLELEIHMGEVKVR